MLKERMRELDGVLGGTEVEGILDTPVPGVSFFRATRPVPRAPLLYNAGLVIIGQGEKLGWLDGQRFRYDAQHYLVVSMQLPFECETRASPDNPLLGVFVDINVAALKEMVDVIEAATPSPPPSLTTVRCAVEPAPLEGAMLEATLRLLRTLCDPVEAGILGKARAREVIYQALAGPHGPALRALTRTQSTHARVARALAMVHERYREPIGVAELAQVAGMSTSAFHRAFKVVTGEPPLKYVKKVRLHKAFGRLVHQGLTVREAAFDVGYGSASQFSREFKRYFGKSPSEVERADEPPHAGVSSREPSRAEPPRHSRVAPADPSAE